MGRKWVRDDDWGRIEDCKDSAMGEWTEMGQVDKAERGEAYAGTEQRSDY